MNIDQESVTAIDIAGAILGLAPIIGAAMILLCKLLKHNSSLSLLGHFLWRIIFLILLGLAYIIVIVFGFAGAFANPVFEKIIVVTLYSSILLLTVVAITQAVFLIIMKIFDRFQIKH